MDYGASDTSTTSLGANQFPISEVYPPSGTQTSAAGGQLTALEGGPASTDANSKRSAPASMYVKDGGDVAQGLTTDAAVTGDNSGTLSAKLRGLSKILADIWDSVNHRIKVDGSGVTQPVSGTVTANVGTPAGSPSYIFKKVQNVSVTAGTGLSIWTPANGKKFRLVGFLLAPTGGGISAIIFQDTVSYNTANEFARAPRVQSTNFTPVPVGLGPNGYLSTAANNQLWIDVSATCAIEGFVYGTEE